MITNLKNTMFDIFHYQSSLKRLIFHMNWKTTFKVKQTALILRNQNIGNPNLDQYTTI